MKTATIYFDFSMSLYCPHCEVALDIESLHETESQEFKTWMLRLVAWLTNQPHADKVDATIQCDNCEETIHVNQIER